MKTTAATLILLSIGIATSFAQLSADGQNQFDEAERRIVRLSPTAFPELPVGVAKELQRRGCKIPQSAHTKDRSNVIKGEFVKFGHTDWAILCSVNGVSSILVFRNGSAKNPAEIAPLEDRIFLQGITANQIEYSREISPAGRNFILQHYEAYGGSIPPPLHHQGINDAFVEKASIVWYFHDGKWLRLSGAD